MAMMYGNREIPKRVSQFEMKLRIMLDRRCMRARRDPQNNVIQFDAKRSRHCVDSDAYIEACQRLLEPVREFFLEDDDDGSGSVGPGINELDGYLGELSAIQDDYADQLAEEQSALQSDVAELQIAGVEFTNDYNPDALIAYGNDLLNKYFANYAELAELGGELDPIVKQAYADVKGMIEQAKRSRAHSSMPAPNLTR